MSSTITSNTFLIYLRQTSSTSVIEYSFDNSTWNSISGWEVTLTTSATPSLATPLVVTLMTDLTINSTNGGTNGYFIIGNDYTTFEGNNKKVTIDTVTNYPGFIQNGTDPNGSNIQGKNNVTIQNLGVEVNTTGTASTLAGNGGWIGQEYFGYGASNNVANNCYSTGDISRADSGGIFGSYAGIFSGNTSANNCYSTGDISGTGSGGIFGSYAGSTSGTASATNCYTTGLISGNESGGIFGASAGFNSGNASAINCYSIETITNGSGGIFGSNAGYSSGNASANNCYSTGGISDYFSGGIFGRRAGHTSGIVFANNCYSTGAITGQYSGGIFGDSAGSSSGNVSATNCYSTGDISGTLSGGIFGEGAGYFSGNVFATNCYSSGLISSGADGIGFPAGDATTYNLLNIYVANGSWSDTLANGILLGFPTTSLNVASVWTSLASNTPYLLTAFNDSNYTPSFEYNSTLTTGNYTTSAGIFTTGYTYQLFGITGTPGTCSIATDGKLTFTGITTTGNEQYDATVISYKTSGTNKISYNISHFYINPPNPANLSSNPTTGNANGGTTVTILGQNLIDVSRVQFGTTDATSFTINSANKITAISPSGTGTVSITITSTYVSPTSVNNFTYSASTDQSPLTITSLNGTNGTALTLTTVGGSGTGAVSYTILAGGTTTGTLSGSSPYTLTTTTRGTVAVQATKAAQGTYSAITSPVTTITFRDNQTVPLAITPTSGTSPLTLSNPSPGIALNVLNASYYSIYPYGTTATGTSMVSFGTLSSSANGTLSATSSGNVIVYATNSGNSEYNSQRTRATINLTVNSVSSGIPPVYLLPPVPIILIQPESQTAELGENIELFVVAEDGYTLTDKNIAKYQWYKNTVPYTPVDVPIPNSNSPILILENITADDEGDYYVVITNKLGGSTISHIAQITVVVPNLLMIDQNTIDNENIEEPNILDILDNINNSL